MNGLALLGIFLIIYACLIIWLTIKKPATIWKMAKIQMFIKALGEKGTEIFFYVFSVIALGAGIWLLIN